MKSKFVNTFYCTFGKHFSPLFLGLLIIGATGSSRTASAQADPSGPDTELFPKAYGTYDHNQIDSINLVNGKLNLNIPVVSYPQRGGKLSMSFSIQYQSIEYTRENIRCPGGPDPGACAPLPQFEVSGGMYLLPSFLIDADNPGRFYRQLANGTGFMSVDGTGHQFFPCDLATSPYPNQSVRIDSLGTLYSEPCSGSTQTSANPFLGTITDSNGNQITEYYQYGGAYNNSIGSGVWYLQGWTDTMGRNIPSWPSPFTGVAGSNGTSWTVPGIYGGTATYNFAFQSMNPALRITAAGYCGTDPVSACLDTSGSGLFGMPQSNTLFPGVNLYSLDNVPGAFGLPPTDSDNPYATTGPLSEFDLPDGTSYKFSWDMDTGSGDHFGDLTQITLPTGGTISYTWTNFPSQLLNPPVLLTACNSFGRYGGFARTISSRTVNANDGTGPQTWTYTLVPVNTSGGPTTYNNVGSTNLNNPGSPYGMLVTDPAGNQTLHVFAGISGSCSYYEVDTEYYQGQVASQNLLTQTQTTYAANPGYSPNVMLDEVWPTSITTPVSTTTYDSYVNGPSLIGVTSNGTSVQESSHFNEPTSVTTTDLITGKTTRTLMGYEWQAASQYFSAGLLSLAQQTSLYQVNGSANTLLALTNYSYDNPNLLQSSNGLMNLVASPQGATRGNLTTTSHWVNTTNTYLNATQSWYTSGMPYQVYDTNNNITQTVLYDSAYAGAYPTEVDTPLWTASKATYDFNTGLLTSKTDQNSKTQTLTYYSSGMFQLGRVNLLQNPDGGTTTLTYPNATTTNISSTITSGQSMNAVSIVDGLGRSLQSQLLNVPAPCAGGIIYQEVLHDFADRTVYKSLPYCNSLGEGVQAGYDALGRILYASWRDGTGSSYDYPTLSSQDEYSESGNMYTRFSDAGGRLIKVFEPSDQAQPGNYDTPTVETDYSYDWLGNLSSVMQLGDSNHQPQDPVNQRVFTYDSLSRPVLATNPESGTIHYQYDSLGNLQMTTDARLATQLACYDLLGRILSTSSVDTTCPQSGPSANPDIVYTYDTAAGSHYSQSNLIGNLSSTHAFLNGNEQATELYSYDVMERQSAIFEALPSEQATVAHETDISYNYLGDVMGLTYPSGRKVSMQFDAADRLLSVQDVTAGIPGTQYLANATYDPSGRFIQANIGNIVTSTATLDDRSRMTEWKANNSLLGTFADHLYNFDQNVPNQLDSESNALQTSPASYINYGYDALDRLASFTSVSATGNIGQTYTYTASGNLTQQNTGMPAPQPATPAYGANNKLVASASHCQPVPFALGIDSTNPAYDLSGNSLCDGVAQQPLGTDHQYIFNPANQLTQVYSHSNLAAMYTYSGEGNRIRKDNIGSGTFQEYVWAGGKVLSEHSSTNNWTDYIYANGQKIARLTSLYQRLHLNGTGCGPNNEVDWNLSINSVPIGVGDKMVWLEDHADGQQSYLKVQFSNNTWIFQGAMDPQSGIWQTASVDLSAWAGDTLWGVWIAEIADGSGNMDAKVVDLALIKADGTVIPYFNGQPSVPGSNTTSCPNSTVVSESVPVENGAGPLVATKYYTADSLGTTKLELSAGGWPMWEGQFSPFGQELDQMQTAMKYKFTGQERDSESGQDNFNARYYNSATGRFSSPDPSGLSFADLGHPQTLNLYNYAIDNPMAYSDPSGLSSQGCDASGAEDNGQEQECEDSSDNHTPLNINFHDTGNAFTRWLLSAFGGPGSPDPDANIDEDAPNWGGGTGVPTRNPATPFQVGEQWLTGAGPRTQVFHDGDPFTEMLRHHSNVQDVIQGVRNGTMGPTGTHDYNLGGVQGIGLYIRDYSTVITGGRTGNLAVTYLGSYSLDYTTEKGVITFTVKNTSTLGSATHLPYLGYTSVGGKFSKFMTGLRQTGPLSPTTQIFIFHERIVP